MSEYINRNELLITINENVSEAHNERCVQLLEAILNAPTADVVEVVRCRDCLFASVEDGKIKCYNTYGLLVTKETEYCSRGRRKDDGT